MKDGSGDKGRGPATGPERNREEVAPRGKPAPERDGPKGPPPETDEHPAPGIEHEPEPDAENIVPAKDRPGTL